MGTSTDQPTAQPGVRASRRGALTLAVFAAGAGLTLAPGVAFAATDATATAIASKDDPTAVDSVDVTAGRKLQASSPKYTADLVDTPQTITIVPKAVIEAQSLLTLRDILSTVPGITFGAGEGGGGYGDSINLRGYAASSDITVDGVRDSAQYTRSDPFDLDQIEVTNGANGVYSGSGSVGGSVNLISKSPLAHDEAIVSAGGGTDGYGRLTVDANAVLGNGVAVRLNAMAHQNDVPGREVENYRRWGVAPSISVGLDTSTRATLSFFHQYDDNIPQYGVPFYNGRAVPGIDPRAYYGYANIDAQRTTVDSFTAKFDHDFSSNLSIRNLSRYQAVTALSIVDPPQGVVCLASGLKPVGTTTTTGGFVAAVTPSGYSACTASDPTPGFYQPSGPRGNKRTTRNTEIYNQTEVTAKFSTGSFEHSLTAGASILAETFYLDTGRIFNNPGATPTVVFPQMTLVKPNNIYSGPINYVRASKQDGQRDNEAVYVFDAIKIAPNFEINGGVRYDHNEGVNSTDTYQAAPPTGAVTTPVGTLTPGEDFRNSDDLFSYRVGAVFKPTAASSLYVAYGNTETPSQSAVNGACTAATCNVDPEQARNIEVGGKWDALEGKLSLTAAVFRNERNNYKVADPNNPDNPSGFQTLDGASRVDGVALGASGKVTERWAVFANYTHLHSEVLRSVSRNTAATVGDFVKGDPLTQAPDNAASLFTTYDLPWHRIQVGYGVTYQGAYYLTQHASVCSAGLVTIGGIANQCPATATQTRSTAPLIQSEPYWVSRLSITWRASKRAEARLNVNNLFDREYFTRVRNNGWATPGDTRNATLTLNYRF